MDREYIRVARFFILRLCHALTAMSLVACSGVEPAQAAVDHEVGDTITIYSTATPGAISPEMYRPVAGRGQY